jgi:hypothetical protein
MGARSDLISETFVPGEHHRSEQLARVRALIANGFSREQVAAMLSIPVEQLSEEALQSEN